VFGNLRVGGHGHQRFEICAERIGPFIHYSVRIDPGKLLVEQLLYRGRVSLVISRRERAIGFHDCIVLAGLAALRSQQSRGYRTKR